MSADKLVLPEYVRAYIRRVWSSPTPDRSHAAKQAVCWAANTIFPNDEDALVNTAISAGRLAERLCMAKADDFIATFEAAILNQSVSTDL